MAERFYDLMERDEPALAALHAQREPGKVTEGTRERFALFLIEWLGGPAAYSPTHGHPRLRMRHANVKIDTAMRDAWLRAMNAAVSEVVSDGDAKEYLDARFADVADFLRNTHD